MQCNGNSDSTKFALSDKFLFILRKAFIALWVYNIMLWKKISPYIIHTRPVGTFVFGLYFLIGVLLAFILDWNATIDWLWAVIAWIAWNTIGNGAILSFNTHYDQDEGDIGFLNSPPKIPKHLNLFAWALFILGGIISFYINNPFFFAYLFFAIFGILYSMPPIRLRNIIGADLVVNVILYGFLTPLAGFLSVNQHPEPYVYFIFGIMGMLLGSGHPLTQLYQYDEDKKKDNKNMTVTLGKKKAILVSIILGNVTYLILLAGIIFDLLPKLMLITLPIYLIANFYVFYWYKNYTTINEKKWMYRGYALNLIIDVVLVLCFL